MHNPGTPAGLRESRFRARIFRQNSGLVHFHSGERVRKVAGADPTFCTQTERERPKVIRFQELLTADDLEPVSPVGACSLMAARWRSEGRKNLAALNAPSVPY